MLTRYNISFDSYKVNMALVVMLGLKQAQAPKR
jgi:hypothetical protein